LVRELNALTKNGKPSSVTPGDTQEAKKQRANDMKFTVILNYGLAVEGNLLDVTTTLEEDVVSKKCSDGNFKIKY
jgi:hypothetical protein